MPIPVYPATPIPRINLSLENQYSTLTTEFDSGAEQVKNLRRFSKRIFNLTYVVNNANRVTLQNFFKARRGGWEAFWFVHWASQAIIDEYVGRGTGSVQTFDLHGKTTSSRTMYVNGSSVGAVSYSGGTGEASADRVTFTVAPVLGSLITSDFTGFLRIKARFAEDKLREETLSSNLTRIELILREVFW